MSGKNNDQPAESSDGVDMNKIKDMMGPLPNERGSEVESAKKETKIPIKVVPKTAPEIAEARKAVNEAAEEAIATLKAMSSDMGEASIVKIDDDGQEVTAEQPLNSPQQDQPSPAETTIEKKDVVGVLSDDPATVAAVDDIIAHESDDILNAEDKKINEQVKDISKKTWRDKIRDIWAKSWVKRSVIAGVVLSLLAIAIYPTTRYFALNTLGIRASLGIQVIDSSNQQPLKNATVTVSQKSVQTDAEGRATLTKLKLGPSKLVIEKRAFSKLSKDVVVGWGSNPKGQVTLTASGAQYSFIVTDYLSGKPVDKAEATSGDGNATSDKNGKLIITLDTAKNADTDELTIQITGSGYRGETVKITAGNREVKPVKLVPSQKSVYVSKRSGKYDVYTVDIDGKNEKKIVSGTGIERDDITLAPMQNSDLVAYVATRENARNKDGFLLSTLYVLDTKSATLTKADQSEQIQLVGWSGEGRLIYAKISAGSSAANPKRHRLMSLLAKNTSDNKELAAANTFNDVVMAGNKVLYAPSNALQDNPKPGLFMVNSDGTSPVTITDKEVSTIFRTDYDTVTYSQNGGSYIYKIGSSSASVAQTASPSKANRLYIDNVTGTKSVWLDENTARTNISVYDKTTKKDTVRATSNDLKTPYYWLNDKVIIYRVSNGKTVSEYAVSVDGGDAKKVQDVSDVMGIGRWFYY